MDNRLLTAEEKESFLKAVQMAVDNDVITSKECDAIIWICIDACQSELEWMYRELEGMMDYAKRFCGEGQSCDDSPL